jgi:hypothetical protein
MKLIDGSLWILLKKCYLVFVIDMFMIVSMFVFNNFYPISYNNEYDFLNFLLTILVGGGVYLIMALVLIKIFVFLLLIKSLLKIDEPSLLKLIVLIYLKYSCCFILLYEP